MRVVKLVLQALMQSYSDKSIFTETRDTSDIPTRTAVVGMIAGAMGVKRDDFESLDALDESLEIRVRPHQDMPDKMSDMQTIRGAAFPVASGAWKPALPLVTKEYIVGAGYDVYITADDETAKKIADAMQHPVYPTVLGRKCCSPATRVFQGVMDEIPEEEAKACIYL